ncbi:MAG TPA: diacylglycerol kinase family protein [Sphingobacteriaceae bacterium]|nr:diacylglycerol kinase family protein [Sphingobacteriaceae bacterium]
MKKNILFIINPISGGKSKVNIVDVIKQNLSENLFDSSFEFSTSIGHANSLATAAVTGNTDIIVAVGGDGTINEVASAVVNSKKIMGVIPCGSGNGLARSLKISTNKKDAVIQLNRLKIDRIDTGLFNGKNFFNMAGLGFDAQISASFAKDRTRGLKGYIKTAFDEISQYKNQEYRLEIDGKFIEREAFMICIANSSQFGNNAHISPFASLKDGLLDVCIIKPFPLYHFPVMGIHMFIKTAHKSKYVEIVKGKGIRISREEEGVVHLDGEAQIMGKEIEIMVNPLNLSILV